MTHSLTAKFGDDVALSEASPTTCSSISPASATILGQITDAVLVINRQWQLIYMNHHAEAVVGKLATAMLGEPLLSIFPDLKDTLFDVTLNRVMESGNAETFESSYGQHHLPVWVNTFIIDEGVCIIFRDSAMRRRLEIITTCQREALNLALSDESLADVLSVLTKAVENQASQDITAAITLTDLNQQALLPGAAPHLPSKVKALLYHSPVSMQSSPLSRCIVQRSPQWDAAGTSATEWTQFSRVIADSGYTGCWSTPLFATQQKSVLGVFTLFYKGSDKPASSDMQVVDMLSQTASVVIERHQENAARLRAENALNRNEETFNKQRRLYETALSNTPDLLYIFDLDGRFTFANDALLEMWGLTWEQAIGKTCLELGYEPWHADMHMQEIRQVIETKKPIRGDVPFTGTHGRRIYDYIFVPVLCEDGTVEAIAGSTRDVTDRHKAEEAALTAEARRRLALEASHSFGIWNWDLKTNTLVMDERLGSLFNLTQEGSMAGVPIEQVLPHIHADDIERVNYNIERCIAKGIRYNEEYRIVQFDGSIRWGSFRGRVFYDDDGEPSTFAGVGVDVTREREAVEALRKADQRKDEFLATLAHELRNPLAPIRNSLPILSGDLFTESQKSDALDRIDRQVSQMIRLVDDLMDVSRITRGKIRLNRAPMDIRDAIESAVETVQPLLEERKHTLNLTYPDEQVWVDGDLVRLAQIFSNVINNAAKYTQSGGQISIECITQPESVKIVIADNGAGIPADQLDSIFEMFSQVDGVLERSQGGLGIGLTLVRRLTMMHGGSVTVHSDGPGTGSRFEISLPTLAEQPFSPAAGAVATRNADVSDVAIRVLIADDNQDAAITMGWLLEANNCEVTVVEDGFSALEAVGEFTPDLVLLDIGMPGMNGYDLCIALKKNPALADSTFVAQTGWGQPAHVQRSRESGFHYHLVKPLSLDELMPIVAEVRLRKSEQN